MIDVQERRTCFEGQEFRLAAGHDQVRRLLPHDGQKPRGRGVLDDPGILVHQRLHPVEILEGRILRSGGEHFHPQLPQRIDHGPGLYPAGEENRAFPRKTRPVRCDPEAAERLLLPDQPLGPILQDRGERAAHGVIQFPGDVPQRLGGVGHAVERLLQVRHPEPLFHLPGQVGEALGADDHVQPGPVGVAKVFELRVAADAGQDADPEPFEQRLHPPQVAGDVVLADQVDVVVGGDRGLRRPDDVFQQDLPRQPVADVLVADEPRGVDRDHRHRNLFRRGLADRLHVVPRHGGDAGRVDEDRLRLVAVARSELEDGAVELLLASEHHVVFEHLGGEAAAVEQGAAGARPPVVPGVAGAGDRPVYQVNDVGDRHENHAGPVVGAAPLGPLARLRLFAEPGGALFLRLAFGSVVVVGPHRIISKCRSSHVSSTISMNLLQISVTMLITPW